MKKLVISIIVGMLLITVSYLGGHFLTSKDVTTDKKLEEFISNKEGIDNVNILARDYEEDLLAVLYSDGLDDGKLFILEQDEIFKDRYRYFGAGNHTATFATYNGSDSEYGTLIIVYGNNSELQAYSYQFVNDGKQYEKQNIGQYVVDIYLLKESKNISCEGYVYDRNNNLIGEFNSIKQ